MLFTPEHETLRLTVERFCRDQLNPHIDAWEDAGAFPAHEVFRKLAALGLLGLTKPVAVGGTALDYSYAVVLIAATSEPAPGSDTPMHATLSPATAGARNSCCSSALPNRASAGVAMSVCTPIASGTPPQRQLPSASASTTA